MKRISLVVIFLVLLSLSTQAQVTLSGRFGYGFYSMKELSVFQQAHLESLTGIPAHVVSDFPPYINYKAFLSFEQSRRLSKLRFYYGYQTTGSRVSLTDYSGKLTLDLIVNEHSVGVEFDAFSRQVSKTIEIKGYLCFGANTTILKTKDHLEVGDYKEDANYIFYSHGLEIEPGIRAIYKYNKFGIGLSLGYLQDVNLNFYLKGDRKSYLSSDGENFIQPNWAGLRTGVEFSVDISGSHKKAVKN